MNEAVYCTSSKASEDEVLGRHIRAQFAGIAIHTRRIRREVGDAEILQGVRIGGMDQFMRKQAWECQEQRPSTSTELDMSLHSWMNVVQRLDRSGVPSKSEIGAAADMEVLVSQNRQAEVEMLSADAINCSPGSWEPTVGSVGRWVEWVLQLGYIAEVHGILQCGYYERGPEFPRAVLEHNQETYGNLPKLMPTDTRWTEKRASTEFVSLSPLFYSPFIFVTVLFFSSNGEAPTKPSNWRLACKVCSGYVSVALEITCTPFSSFCCSSATNWLKKRGLIHDFRPKF